MSEKTIDDVTPSRVERPDSADSVAELIREANGTGSWLVPVGGGTAMMGANPVDDVPVAIDLTGIVGVTEYQPADLTVSVNTGTRWSDLQETLRREGQTIPIDVPLPERAIVGGVVATGYAGPRRLRDGTLKDLLLGASYVRGDGLAAKAGGMVVKNVSGFEIPRLLHGSWGSLAVITSVNFKVIPAHEFELTVEGDAQDMIETCERVLGLTGERSAIAAAVVDGTLESGTVAVRLTGRERPTRELAAEIEADARLPWARAIDEAATSARWWQDREDRLAGGDPHRVSIEIGSSPSRIVETLATLRRAIPDSGSISVHASPGVGAVTIEFPAAAMSLDTWARLWAEHGLSGHARFVVASAPRVWRAGRDVWFIEPGPRRLMQSLKSTFDPNDVLNRGRLWTAPAAAHQVNT